MHPIQVEGWEQRERSWDCCCCCGCSQPALVFPPHTSHLYSGDRSRPHHAVESRGWPHCHCERQMGDPDNQHQRRPGTRAAIYSACRMGQLEIGRLWLNPASPPCCALMCVAHVAAPLRSRSPPADHPHVPCRITHTRAIFTHSLDRDSTPCSTPTRDAGLRRAPSGAEPGARCLAHSVLRTQAQFEGSVLITSTQWPVGLVGGSSSFCTRLRSAHACVCT